MYGNGRERHPEEGAPADLAAANWVRMERLRDGQKAKPGANGLRVLFAVNGIDEQPNRAQPIGHREGVGVEWPIGSPAREKKCEDRHAPEIHNRGGIAWSPN